MEFIGRKKELEILDRHLSEVGSSRSDRAGQCLIIRGRRRVGKSRLIEKFRQDAHVPSVFFTAARTSPEQDLISFVEAVTSSNLPDRGLFVDSRPSTWDAALRLLGTVLPDNKPSIVVIDELPFLTATVDGFEGLLQRAWDRVLSHKPVLLLLIGSDLSIMEALNHYDRPFHQRGKPMLIQALTPGDVQMLTKLPAAAAFDAHLVTGGLPLICAQWQPKMSVTKFLTNELADPTSALTISGELSLAAEFPPTLLARSILSSIGSGESTFTSIIQTSRASKASAERALPLLVEKRVVAAERPLSTAASKETRYRVDDPYLRFWLRFIEPSISDIDRGRSDRVVANIQAGWSTWRGRAIEPIVREALWRLLPDEKTQWLKSEHTAAMGGYWTRTNDVEIDIVAADKQPVARHIGFVGSVKWREKGAFARKDLTSLTIARDRLPGATAETPLVAVTRMPSILPGVDAHYHAEDLMNAWHT